MNKNYIPDGCIMLARKIQDSAIWDKPADWLKIWIYFLQGVNHNGTTRFSRGENFFNVVEMARDCGVSRHSIYNFMKWAKSTTLVTTRKTTRGVVLTVLNYDKYQTLDNYKYDTENDTSNEFKTKQKRNRNDTINKNVKNDKNDKNTIADKSAKPIGEQLRPMAIYFLCRQTLFENVEQIRAEIPRHVRVSSKLAAYSNHDLAFAYFLAMETSDGKWEVTLETVQKTMLKSRDFKPGTKDKAKIESVLAKFDKHKDTILTAKSILITPPK